MFMEPNVNSIQLESAMVPDEETPFHSEGTVTVPKMTVSDAWEQLRTAIHYWWKDFSARSCVKDLRQSKKLVLFIVFVALLLDNMLMTVIVPIVPDYIIAMDHHRSHKVPMLNQNCTVNNSTTEAIYTTCFNETTTWNITNSNSSGSDTTPTTITDSVKTELEKQEDNVKIGLLFASKAFFQLLANPIVGPLTNRFGYSLLMFIGFTIMFTSTLVFAFGETYTVLLIARSIQGVGSSCSSVAGMGMLAQRYSGNEERGSAMGIALAGLAFGVLIGPPFGGIMYDFVGKESAFYALAGLALLDGLLQLFVLNPGFQKEAEMEGTPLCTLLRDPYIVIAAGAITFGNMGIALLEPSLPIWMMDNMHVQKWQIGAIFLPASFSYLISTNIFGPWGYKLGRWLCSLLGMIVAGVAMLTIPLAKSVPHLIAPNFLLGFAVGMVDATMMPIMAYLVDIRHVSVYGSVYAIADVAFCIGFAIGPSLSGEIVHLIGFPWFLRIVALLGFLYAPLCYFLRDPPVKEDKMSILMEERLPVSYSTHKIQQQTYNSIQDDPGYHTMGDDLEYNADAANEDE